jgi:hypothetical protein
MSQFVDSLKKKAQELNGEKLQLHARILRDQTRLNDLISAIDGIEKVLRVEGVDATSPKAVSAVAPSHSKPDAESPPVPLYDVLSAALADGKPHEVTELIEVARTRGVQFGSKDPHKAVSFTLLGISRGKKIHRNDDGRWQRVS